MAELVLSLGGSLLVTLQKARAVWEQKQMNEEIQGELERFVRELQYNIRHLQEKSQGARFNNAASWALDALQKDLEIADLDAKNILNKGFFKSVWDANKTRGKLERLRERVMTSFQTRLILALLDVAIESQQEQESFQTAMSNMNKELVELYCSKADLSLKKSMQDVIRKELQMMLNPLMVAIKSDGRRDVEMAMSMIRNTSAQTSETEKFFEDVLAGLEDVLKQSGLSEKDKDPLVGVKQDINDSKIRPHNDAPKWYQDPITWETMCDPVKANDGHTYDRWTILRHPSTMVRSPFSQDENHRLLIERDDISIRSHLFQKFPDQVAKFKAERDAYRNAALQAVINGNFGESLIMLNHVLKWDPRDVECSNMLDHVQHQLDGDVQGTSLHSEAIVQELERGDNNSPLTSSRSSAQVQLVHDGHAASLTSGHQTQNLNSAGKKEDGNDRQKHNVGEKDELVLEMVPKCFDRASTDNEAVVLSTDGLVATYKLGKGPGATVIGNARCPSDCYPFYFEVLVHPSSDGHEQDVAIGFSIAGVARGGLGTYSGSCGYYALQGKVSYVGTSGSNDSEGVHYPRGNASGTSQRRGGYVVGAGLHTGIGIVFFMLDGNVVALLEAARFSCGHPLFPAVSLHSHGTKVKANFGPTWVSWEHWPTGFDAFTDSSRYIRAVMTNRSVPMRINAFYFEILVNMSFFKRDVLDVFRTSVKIGFAGTSTFLNTRVPGSYANSCGLTCYNDGCGCIQQNGRTESPEFRDLSSMIEDKNSESYRVGVGIHYGTNEIFFTVDGFFLYSVRNTLQWPVNPVVAVMFNKLELEIPWRTDVGGMRLPSKLHHSICSNPKFMATLDAQGLKARHTGRVTDTNNDISQYFGVAAFRADMVAPLLSPAHDATRKPFYFELMVADEGENGYIAIGFSHFQHFHASEQLGCYNYSCAYHGNTGKLFTGAHTGKDFGPTFSTGDRVGAGLNHHTNTIFFVKNGEVIGCTRNEMGTCALYPAVGLGSYGEEVHLRFPGFDNPFSKTTAADSSRLTGPSSSASSEWSVLKL